MHALSGGGIPLDFTKFNRTQDTRMRGVERGKLNKETTGYGGGGGSRIKGGVENK